MSLNLPEILQSLAISQLQLVAPELGESYAGKTASLIGVLALVAAGLQDRLQSEAPVLRQRLEELLTQAQISDAAVQQHVQSALMDEKAEGWFARQDALMQALTEVHAWADSNDAALARQCREFLCDHAAAEMVAMPDLEAVT